MKPLSTSQPPHSPASLLADRRGFLGGLASAAAACPLACPLAAFAAGSVGLVETSMGEALAQAHGATRPLATGADIFVGDLVSTSAAARLVMLLGATTRVRLGANTRLRIDRFLAGAGGELSFDSGPIVVDHDENAPPTNLRLRSPFGLIAVRGTRFFAGPSNGSFGVFVERGIVDFTAAGETVRLTAGEGTDVKHPGDKPSAKRRWPAERANDAMLSTY